MSVQTNGNGVQLAPAPQEPVQPPSRTPFSWLQPHPIFVIVLVGPDEQPFGIQKDFLCDRSSYFRNYFATSGQNTVEHIVKLPEASRDVFGLAQHFLFTGQVMSDATKSPSYEDLVGLWKLGHKLDIDGLCDRTLQTMIDCRRLTERIPSTPLLIQVWKETPEGSSIRKLLLSWAAEYMRSSDARAEFAKSLPQEVLSELVVTMSSFDVTPLVQAPVAPLPNAPASGPSKNVHYLESRDDDETLGSIKRSRRSSGGASAATPLPLTDSKGSLSRKASRPSLNPAVKPQKRRSSAAFVEGRTFTTAQKLDFCADLLTRMLSGPGFWTRLVGPFKEPVVPEEDGVPDYFEKVKRPMDLSSIKSKMDRREYADEEEFLGDMRQIFENCFLYWKKGDPMWAAGEKLQKTFEEKYSGMNKWIAKMGGDEGE